MRLNAREKILFIIAAVLVGCFAAYVFAYVPMRDKWNRDGVLIQERRQRLSALQDELDRSRAQSAKYKQAVHRLESDSERHATPLDLFTEVQNLSAPANVAVKDVNPLPDREHEHYTEVTVLVDIESDLAGLVHFLYLLKSNGDNLDVTRVTVAPVEPGEPALRAQAQVSTKIFRREAAKP